MDSRSVQEPRFPTGSDLPKAQDAAARRASAAVAQESAASVTPSYPC